MAKKELKQNIQSVFEKMAEAYRDCDDQKSKVITALKNRRNSTTPEDIEDHVDLAKAENDNFKLLDNLIDKKIKLIQLHAKLVLPVIEAKGEEIAATQQILSEEAMKSLRQMAEEEFRNDINYNLEEK